MAKATSFVLFLAVATFSDLPCSRAGEPKSQMSAEILSGLPKFDSNIIPHEFPDAFAGAIALPRLEIRAERAPAFSEREVHTKSGMSELLSRRYLGASFPGQDPENSLFTNYAAAMYRDDRRAEQLSQLKRSSEASMLEGGEEARRLSKDIKEMYYRKLDWRTEAIDRSVNHWRN